MKAFRILLAISASGLLALPACAQGFSGSRDTDVRAESRTSAMVFLRIPLGGSTTENEAPRLGFGVFSGCSASLGITSEPGRDACSAQPFRSIELSTSFNTDAPWALSFGGAARRASIASWSPRTGALSLAGEGNTDGNGWVWIGLGALAVVGVASALGGDDDPTICPDGFVAVPLGNGCQPIS